MSFNLLQKLTGYLRDNLEKRDWVEFNQAVYRCANCTTQFCIDKQNHKAAERGKLLDVVLKKEAYSVFVLFSAMSRLQRLLRY